MVPSSSLVQPELAVNCWTFVHFQGSSFYFFASYFRDQTTQSCWNCILNEGAVSYHTKAMTILESLNLNYNSPVHASFMKLSGFISSRTFFPKAQIMLMHQGKTEMKARAAACRVQPLVEQCSSQGLWLWILNTVKSLASFQHLSVM